MTNPLEPMMDDIIARIEAGVPPWRAPWDQGLADPTLPLRSDGKPFSGANMWLLAFAGAEKGYASPYWFTFKQALAINAPVRTGEKGCRAVLYKTRVVEGEGGEEDNDVRRYLSTYTVFNACQLTDCPAEYLTGPPIDPAIREQVRTRALDSVPAKIILGGGRALYSPALDEIRLPPPEAFDTPDDFLATKAHELVHWTAHPSRLDRAMGEKFGDQAYAFEELVAEIGACGLGLHIGLKPQLLDGHAAYLAHWARILKARPRALVEASTLAQKAVDHLLSYSAQPSALAEAA